MPIVMIIPWAYDYITECVVTGLQDLGLDFRADQASNGVLSATPHSTLVDLINSGSMVIVCTGIGLNTSLLGSIPHLGRMILIDGTDFSDFESLKALRIDLTKVRAIFKREFLTSWHQSQPLERLYPFPMCATSNLTTVSEPKQYLLTFLGNTRTNPLRGVYMDWVYTKAKMGENVKGGSTGECSYDSIKPKQQRIETPNYKDILARSLSSISVPGAGFDCKRYWEIPNSQSLILAHHTPISIPNDFISGKEKLDFRDPAELEEIFQKLKKNPQFALDLINAASVKLKQYHTAKKRMEYLLEIVFR